MKVTKTESWIIKKKCPRCDGPMVRNYVETITGQVIMKHQGEDCIDRAYCGYVRLTTEETIAEHKMIEEAYSTGIVEI